MNGSLIRFMTVIAASAMLAACGGDFGTKEDEGGGATVTESSTASGTDSGASATTSGVGTGTGFQGHPLDDPASPLSTRTIYFDFDSAEVGAADQAVIEAHARYLASNPSATVTLEGHADERGTREYNLALGERRGNAVRQLMGLVGASAQQMRVNSYGEERPAAEGHDESAWSLNRRVEVIYRTR